MSLFRLLSSFLLYTKPVVLFHLIFLNSCALTCLLWDCVDYSAWYWLFPICVARCWLSTALKYLFGLIIWISYHKYIHQNRIHTHKMLHTYHVWFEQCILFSHFLLIAFLFNNSRRTFPLLTPSISSSRQFFFLCFALVYASNDSQFYSLCAYADIVYA